MVDHRRRWMLGTSVLLLLSTLVLISRVTLSAPRSDSVFRPTTSFSLMMSYTQVLHRLAPWMAARTSVALDLPSVSLIGADAKFDVGYRVPLKNGGYRIVLTDPGMAKTRQNALTMPAAGADYVGELWGFSAHTRWQKLVPTFGWFRLAPPHSATTISSTLSVSVLPHQTDLEQCWEYSSLPGDPQCQVVWHQDRWALAVLNVNGLGISIRQDLALTLGEAQDEAHILSHRKLPGRDGKAVIPMGETFGASASAATYQLGPARYFIVAMGGQAPIWAEHMQHFVRR